ncbi:unnamed protein product [Callosobruchus maculatus]|uniref:Cuticle protein n=2 Tax=Callosobruchus maculatus TaxID=64391 RepID=A0A653C9L6_CALMS|nr:unnamed protein product [Callosobruchus maculatus]
MSKLFAVVFAALVAMAAAIPAPEAAPAAAPQPQPNPAPIYYAAPAVAYTAPYAYSAYGPHVTTYHGAAAHYVV